MKLANRLPAAAPAVQAARQWVAAAGRDLWHALAGGPDHPPRTLRRLRQTGTLPTLAPILVTALAAWLVVASFSPELRRLGGGSWRPVIILLTLGLLLIAAHRPLLAWRLTMLVFLYELLLVPLYLLLMASGPLPWLFPPVIVSELQVLVGLVVLFTVAASQPFGVVRWVWLLTIAPVWVMPLLDGIGIGIGRLAGEVLPPDWYPMIEETFDIRGWSSFLPVEVVALQAGVSVLLTGVVLVGQLVYRRSEARSQLAVAQEQGLVLTERARIARELHDVVAHHMSMIAVRAETAPYRLAEVGQPARQEFEAISRESRTALSEMRRLLGVLRSDGTPAPTTPQPGLSDLGDLVEAARAAGASVGLEMHGAMAGLPPAVDLSAYRIVQEALANAAQHAAGAAVRVILRRTPGELEVVVRNGPGGRPSAGTGPTGDGAVAGHGVRGMRERVTMLGGTLYAGLTADGGFEVSVTLPLSQERT